MSRHLATQNILRVVFIGHAQGHPEVGVGAQIVLDDTGRPLRGQDEMQAERPSALGDIDDAVDEVEIRSLPLSSWSADPAEASAFARSYGRSIQVVFTARVPAEAVFSYPGSGFGCGPESEMVVLGVDGAVAVSWSADTG